MIAKVWCKTKFYDIVKPSGFLLGKAPDFGEDDILFLLFIDAGIGIGDVFASGVSELRKKSLAQSPSDPSLVSGNGRRRPSPNILLPTQSSPLPGSISYKRRLSVPLPQEGLLSPSSDLSSNASTPRRPSYVSAKLAASGRIL